MGRRNWRPGTFFREKKESSSDVRNDTNDSLRWTNERSRVDRREKKGSRLCVAVGKILPRVITEGLKVNGRKRKEESLLSISCDVVSEIFWS